MFITTKFGENFEEQMDINLFLNVLVDKVWLTVGISTLTPPIMKN